MVSKRSVNVSISVLALVAAGTLTTGAALGQVGTWMPYGAGNTFPGNAPDTALLMTDGSVIMHDICTANWFRLLPSNTGSYTGGTWSAFAPNDRVAIAAMPGGYGPLFYASAVLPDTRVVVQGGEFENSANNCNGNTESTLGAMYNPHNNTWSAVNPPPTWATIGDSNSIILGPNNLTKPDGVNTVYSAATYALSNNPDNTAPQNREMALATIPAFPGTGPFTWTRLSAGKADRNSEENFTLLPNGMVLTIDNSCIVPPVFGPCVTNPTNSELFNQSSGSWSSAGTLPAALTNDGGMNIVPETGPLVSIGFNMAVQFGGNNNTAVFSYRGANPNPSGSSWIAGPAFPAGQFAFDGPAALLPNGNILVQTSGAFTQPSLMWEFQSSILTPQNFAAPPPFPPLAANVPPCNDPALPPALLNGPSFGGRMLVLPTGQILWSQGQSQTGFINCTSVYTTNVAGNPNPIMRPAPHINTISNNTLTRGTNNYVLTGSMFKGVSQGASYGNDAQMATNWPVVRITNNSNGHVCWGRTHDWQILTSTQFDVPATSTGTGGNADWPLLENQCDTAGGGASTLVVITNGLVSNSIQVTVN
jgi:hypothetical protein